MKRQKLSRYSRSIFDFCTKMRLTLRMRRIFGLVKAPDYFIITNLQVLLSAAAPKE